jgi:hypothetical protein
VLANHSPAPRLKEGQMPSSIPMINYLSPVSFSSFHLIHLLKGPKDVEDTTNMAGEKTPHFETLQLHAGKED